MSCPLMETEIAPLYFGGMRIVFATDTLFILLHQIQRTVSLLHGRYGVSLLPWAFLLPLQF